MPDDSLPAAEPLKDLAEVISKKLGPSILSHHLEKDELVLHARRDDVVKILVFLRDDKQCDFKLLIDVCGADYPDRLERFEVVYSLLSLRYNHRVRLKVDASEDDLVPSVIDVFSSAGWFEREVWDMYGVLFSGHPDLRRILTDYGFEGHPQRKDFPLTGTVELRYDDELKRVVYEPVKLTQDFRNFDTVSPWEAMTAVQLPGDEKAVKPGHGYKESKKAV